MSNIVLKYYLYIVTNRPKGVLYLGITNNLKSRIGQHKRKVHPKTFSARYNTDKLVYFEILASKQEALTKEKQMKKWYRAWKIALIEKMNPNWNDLSEPWNLSKYDIEKQ